MKQWISGLPKHPGYYFVRANDALYHVRVSHNLHCYDYYSHHLVFFDNPDCVTHKRMTYADIQNIEKLLSDHAE